MDRSTFWEIIDISRAQADGDLVVQMERLQSQVEQLNPSEIADFGRIFEEYSNSAYTWDLWGAAYIIGGGCSDDAFLDFRGWLISRGQVVYETALKDPDSLAGVVQDDDDCMYEGFQGVAMQAWRNRQDTQEQDYPDHGLIQPMEPAGRPWSEEGNDFKERFPKLWSRFSIPPPRYIRIVATPPGEAPPAIRAGWIGCILPLLPGIDQPQTTGMSRGIISGRPGERSPKYKVSAVNAFAALEQHDAEAARWWRQNLPHLFQPRKLLAFSAASCELLPPRLS
jgi:hypothetical protein